MELAHLCNWLKPSIRFPSLFYILQYKDGKYWSQLNLRESQFSLYRPFLIWRARSPAKVDGYHFTSINNKSFSWIIKTNTKYYNFLKWLHHLPRNCIFQAPNLLYDTVHWICPRCVKLNWEHEICSSPVGDGATSFKLETHKYSIRCLS
jgi:hypothetical protein